MQGQITARCNVTNIRGECCDFIINFALKQVWPRLWLVASSPILGQHFLLWVVWAIPSLQVPRERILEMTTGGRPGSVLLSCYYYFPGLGEEQLQAIYLILLLLLLGLFTYDVSHQRGEGGFGKCWLFLIKGGSVISDFFWLRGVGGSCNIWLLLTNLIF